MIIKSLPENITAQQIYDHVKQHAKDQAYPATDAQGQCRYRMPDGKACFVGCLIPDAWYKPEMEKKTVSFLIGAGWVPKLLVPHRVLLWDLQAVHDGHHPTQWPIMLETVARHHNLNP